MEVPLSHLRDESGAGSGAGPATDQSAAATVASGSVASTNVEAALRAELTTLLRDLMRA